MPTPTLFLDGIFGRPGRFAAMRRAVESEVGPTEVFHYNATGFVPFETLANRFIARLRQFDQPVNVVAFSMGGIVVRTAKLLDPSLPIRKAVFLNVPHAGSWLATALLIAPGVRQLLPGSTFLKRLAAAPWDVPTLATWCPLDAAVVPGRSANWLKAGESIRCGVPAHTWVVRAPRIHRRVAQFLATDTAESVTLNPFPAVA
jgi:pimeloyl-ACP methyl ester carboxylesterase